VPASDRSAAHARIIRIPSGTAHGPDEALRYFGNYEPMVSADALWKFPLSFEDMDEPPRGYCNWRRSKV